MQTSSIGLIRKLDVAVFGRTTTPILPIRRAVAFNTDSAPIYYVHNSSWLSHEIKSAVEFLPNGSAYPVLAAHLGPYIAAEQAKSSQMSEKDIIRSLCISAVWNKAQTLQSAQAKPRFSAPRNRDALLLKDEELIGTLQGLLLPDDLTEAKNVIKSFRAQIEQEWNKYKDRLLREAKNDESQARWQLMRGLEVDLMPLLSMLCKEEEKIATLLKKSLEILFKRINKKPPQ